MALAALFGCLVMARLAVGVVRLALVEDLGGWRLAAALLQVLPIVPSRVWI